MTRVSKEEMERSMAKAKADKPSSVDPEQRDSLSFTKNAREVKEGHPDTYCKVVYVGESTKYWVLRGPNHKLFNPYDLTYDDVNRKRQQDKHRQPFTLRETNEKVFNIYLQFLKTENRSYLLNAEREEI